MAFLPPLLARSKGVLAGVVISLALGVSMFAAHRGANELIELQESQAALEQKMVRLQRGNDDLRHHLERMKSDPAYLERVVRQRLGWVRPGEIVYRVGDR
jgi:cell division protein FtsB